VLEPSAAGSRRAGLFEIFGGHAGSGKKRCLETLARGGSAGAAARMVEPRVTANVCSAPASRAWLSHHSTRYVVARPAGRRCAASAPPRRGHGKPLQQSFADRVEVGCRADRNAHASQRFPREVALRSPTNAGCSVVVIVQFVALHALIRKALSVRTSCKGARSRGAPCMSSLGTKGVSEIAPRRRTQSLTGPYPDTGKVISGSAGRTARSRRWWNAPVALPCSSR
jgi:hypothetical protein